MPDLTGMRNDESTEAMDEAGIEDYTVEWREGSDPLVVIDQTPEAGEPVTSETEVSVTLSGS
ncbi:MAG TPA: PASTA domain-containing protein [Actinomycetota bacterium]|nr:PASTA domain-containing protein [Actinomycetota bacterium]